MADWLATLRQLQDVDAQLYRIRQEQSRKPKELEQSRQQAQQAQARGKQADDELKGYQVKQKQRELELSQLEEKIRKLQGQLFQVKTNKEYTAVQHEVEQLKADVSLAEEDILTLLDRVDAAKRQHVDAQQQLAQEQERFQDTERRVQEELAAIEREAAGLESQRGSMTPLVDREVLALYQRALQNGDGVALVPLVKEACGGCHMAQRPQVVSQVYLKAHPVICESCQRILYVNSDAVVH